MPRAVQPADAGAVEKPGMEGEVSSPRLVHHERHAVGVGDLGQAGDVRHGAEVGG